MESDPNNNKQEGNQNQQPEHDSETDLLHKAVSELSPEDAEIVLEEFKVLARAEIPNLKAKIATFKIIEEQSEELQEKYAKNQLPEMMRKMYGTEEDRNHLLDELSTKIKQLESLKQNILNKDIEAIKTSREKRFEEYRNLPGNYSLSGKEYHENEDRFNKQLEEERRIEALRKEIDRLSKLN